MIAFDLMLLDLLGEPLPPLPPLQGRVHRLAVEDDGFDVPSVAELVDRFGLTRQGAFLRIQAYRRNGNLAALLRPRQGHAVARQPAPALPAARDHAHRVAALLDGEDSEE